MKTIALIMILLVGCKESTKELGQPFLTNTACNYHYNWMIEYANQHNLTNIVCRNARSFHDDMDICTAETSDGVKIRVAFWGFTDVMPFSITKDPL